MAGSGEDPLLTWGTYMGCIPYVDRQQRLRRVRCLKNGCKEIAENIGHRIGEAEAAKTRSKADTTVIANCGKSMRYTQVG